MYSKSSVYLIMAVSFINVHTPKLSIYIVILFYQYVCFGFYMYGTSFNEIHFDNYIKLTKLIPTVLMSTLQNSLQIDVISRSINFIRQTLKLDQLAAYICP